jgi:PAS domain S-box-containing protein
MDEKQVQQLLLQKNKLVTYLLPLIMPVLATLIKICFFRNTGHSIPFLLYIMVALLAGIASGSKGVLIGLISISACTFFWLIPVTDGVSRYTFVELALFGAETITIALLFRWNEQIIHKLDENQQKYRRIIDRGAEAFLMCDREGRITYASAAVFHLLHCSKDSLTGMFFRDFIHEDERSQFELSRLRLQARGSGTTLLRQRMLCANEDWRWTECCINNLLDDPLVTALIVQMRDISHRVNQERHQEDFVNIASHELKSPVTAIRGFIQIAMKRYNDGKLDNHEQYLNRIHAQTEKLLVLIDDMLNMTRVNAGELAYHFSQTDLSSCLKESVAAIEVATPGRKIHLDIQSNVPMVSADPARIGQVITNLLSNALKYSPGHAPVNAALFQKQDRLVIAITDHGIGIPQDKLKRVFDRFYRVETLPKEKFEGLGLGLFISADIIRKHHGQIWVESKEGEGSVFSFSLPLSV